MKFPGIGLSAAAALALVFALPAHAQTRVWQVDYARSTLGFTYTRDGATHTGYFRRFDALIVYDPVNLVPAKFDFAVATASLKMRNRELEQAALGPDFLDAARFPKAFFVTTLFHKSADGTIFDRGELGLRGVIKTVELKVRFVPHGDTATLNVSVPLKPPDFGVGRGRPGPSPVGKVVTVRAHLSLHRSR